MPNKQYIEREDYTEEVIQWIGLTQKEEEMANAILSSLYSKEAVVLQYVGGKTNYLVRMTGDFWLNNNQEPFESEEELEEWIENEIKEVTEMTTYCRFTEEKREHIKK
jgi:hypothetical protein